MTIKTLRHITTETGHLRISPRAEVDDNVINLLRPLINRSLANGGDVELAQTGWWLQCDETDTQFSARL